MPSNTKYDKYYLEEELVKTYNNNQQGLDIVMGHLTTFKDGTFEAQFEELVENLDIGKTLK